MKCPICGADTHRILANLQSPISNPRSEAEGDPNTQSPIPNTQLSSRSSRGTPGYTYTAGATLAPTPTDYELRRPAGRAQPTDVTTTALWATGSTIVIWIIALTWAITARSNQPLYIGLILGIITGALIWFSQMLESRQLLWLIERTTGRDLDGDDHQGQPPAPAQPTGRIVIRPGSRTPLPPTWDQLPAQAQADDIHRFAELIWTRQQNSLPTGQKAFRGQRLPSGHKLDDPLHAELLAILDQAGLIHHQGRTWTLGARPTTVRRLIQAENW